MVQKSANHTNVNTLKINNQVEIYQSSRNKNYQELLVTCMTSIVLRFESYKLQGLVPDLGNLTPRANKDAAPLGCWCAGCQHEIKMFKYKSKTNIFIGTIVLIYTECTQELGRYTITHLPTLLSTPR